MTSSLLPPVSTPFERALEQATARLGDVPVPVDRLWDPQLCPAAFLPWLGWGVSIDIWSARWTEGEKRAAIAAAIADQRRKGTPAALRRAADRFDELIRIVEWFEEGAQPYTFRLELPHAAQSPIVYSETMVAELLADIAKVKPLRARLAIGHRLRAEAHAWLIGGVRLDGFLREEGPADTAAALDPKWAAYLQTEEGEPIRMAEGPFMEAS